MPGRPPKRMRYTFALDPNRNALRSLNQPVYACTSNGQLGDDLVASSSAAASPFRVFKWVKTGQTVVHEDDDEEETQTPRMQEQQDKEIADQDDKETAATSPTTDKGMQETTEVNNEAQPAANNSAFNETGDVGEDNDVKMTKDEDEKPTETDNASQALETGNEQQQQQQQQQSLGEADSNAASAIVPNELTESNEPNQSASPKIPPADATDDAVAPSVEERSSSDSAVDAAIAAMDDAAAAAAATAVADVSAGGQATDMYNTELATEQSAVESPATNALQEQPEYGLQEQQNPAIHSTAAAESDSPVVPAPLNTDEQ
ncbi:hypothetical protein LPJ72_003837 [Coemansia sp. Benny D160-2]|nr:hypothetical protein LPJ72_003837 [Coemansia sp. Benny D160-2]